MKDVIIGMQQSGIVIFHALANCSELKEGCRCKGAKDVFML
jgi:hypothetical protein